MGTGAVGVGGAVGGGAVVVPEGPGESEDMRWCAPDNRRKGKEGTVVPPCRSHELPPTLPYTIINHPRTDHPPHICRPLSTHRQEHTSSPHRDRVITGSSCG